MDFGLVLKGKLIVVLCLWEPLKASKCTSLSVICSEILKSICISKTEYWATNLRGGGGVIVTLYTCQKILNPSSGGFLTF